MPGCGAGAAQLAVQLRAAQQQYADAAAREAAGQAQIDGARPGVAGDGARAYGQEMVAEAAGAMNAAVARVAQANQAAATQIDALVGQLAEMRGSDPDVLGDEPGHQPRRAAAEDDGGFSLSDIGHGILDIAGLVPVIGEPAVGINAAWYGLEGDQLNAALSAAGMIPIGGWLATGDKFAGKGLDAARGADEAAEAFQARPSYRDRHGFMTDGTYRVSSEANARHSYGTARPGSSYFNEGTDVDQVSMDAAQYADQHDLWDDNKAKVVFEDNVGVHGQTGRPTDVVNVYRRDNGTIHASPGSPQ